MLLLPILFPLVCGVALALLAPRCAALGGKTGMRLYGSVGTALTLVLAVLACRTGEKMVLLSMTDELQLILQPDALGTFFAILVPAVWLCVTVFSFPYMEHEGAGARFYAFSFLTLAAMEALCFSANLITLYLFFECVTLASVPLVLHSLRKEAVSAALKYLFYSVGGALLG
jgi:multicomponent Na+:H+ antiporter subunit D